MRLLAVGRSIVGLRSDRSPYKLSALGTKPTFGMPPGPAVEQSPERAEVAPVRVDAATPVVTRTEPRAVGSFWKRPEPGSAKAGPSLDDVRVKRNDLRDADLEVVTLKKREVPVAPVPVAREKDHELAARQP